MPQEQEDWRKPKSPWEDDRLEYVPSAVMRYRNLMHDADFNDDFTAAAHYQKMFLHYQNLMLEGVDFEPKF